MKKRRIASLLVFILSMFFSHRLTAQLYNVVTYGLKDGLPEERLNCLLQDSKGYIWIGARFGLYKFNGKKFSTPTFPSSVRNKLVNYLLEDSKKRIWVCLNGSGLVLIENNREKHILIKPDDTDTFPPTINSAIVNSINRIFEIHPDLFLVLTDQGAFLYDTHRFISLATHFQQGTPPGYPSCNDAVFEHDSLWLACSEKLYLLKFSNPYKPEILQTYKISGWPLSRQQNGRMLVGTPSGVFYLDPVEKYTRIHKLDTTLEPTYISHIFSEGNSSWVSTSAKGVFLYQEAQREMHLTTENGLPSSLIKYVLKDKEKNYWLATDRGLVIFNDTINKSFFQQRDKSVFITGIALDSTGALWCIKDGAGIWKIKNNQPEKISVTPTALLRSFTPRFSYTHIFCDSQKKMWVVYNDVLMQVDYNGRMQKYFHLPPWLNSWFEDKDGNFWLVSQQLQVLHNDKLYPVSVKNEAGKNITPASLIIDKYGLLWLADIAEGVYLGKIKMDPDSVRVQLLKSFTAKDGLVNTRYSQLTYDETNDVIWAGSFWNGISRLAYRNNKLESLHLNYSNGVAGERMLTLFPDKDRSFFCRSSAGLYHFVPKGNNAYSFDIYTVADGLPANEISALCRDKDGNFWVGTHEGITHFHPRPVISILPSPNVFVEKVSINGEPDTLWNGNNTLSLRHSDNAVSFEFYATSYRNNSRLLYSYLLEGFDNRWSTYTAQNTVNYKNLPPGNYRFLVKAKNFLGIESSAPAICAFIIATPFYKTSWFYGLLASGILILCFLFYRYRIRQVRHEEKIKTDFIKQLSELEIKALRSQMNPHFIFNSLNAINRYILKNEKSEASAYLTKFAKLIRLILEHSRQSRIPLVSEVNALELYLLLESLRFQNNFHYTIQVDDGISLQSVQIPPMIIQPFVENAIWHGLLPKGNDCSLLISFKANGQNLVCVVEDNGIGRKKSAELKQQQVISRISVGMSLTEQRLKLTNQQGERSPSIDIEDLYDSKGEALGTRIYIIIPFTYN